MASTSTDYASLVEFGQKHVTKGVGRIVEGVMTKGEGSYVTFGDGKKFLDFTCGIGVTNLGECCRWFCPVTHTELRSAGHCHPKVSAAAAKQCMEVVHAQVRVNCCYVLELGLISTFYSAASLSTSPTCNSSNASSP